MVYIVGFLLCWNTAVEQLGIGRVGVVLDMSNYNEDVTTAIGALVAVLAVISVALRFYSRHATRTGIKWDDWMILVSLAAVIITDALVLAGSSFR